MVLEKIMTTFNETRIYFVEGNIGAGKTTFLKKLEENPEYQVIYEPVDKWSEIKNSEGKNMLELFYQDPNKYSYLFQSMAFITRCENFHKIDFTKKKVFIERSPFSDKNVFGYNCYSTGLMEEIEWKVYNIWFDNLVETIKINFNFIYLKCSSETSYQRILERDRSGENRITMRYLKQLENLHDIWLQNQQCITLNGELDFKNDDHALQCMISEITNAE